MIFTAQKKTALFAGALLALAIIALLPSLANAETPLGTETRSYEAPAPVPGGTWTDLGPCTSCANGIHNWRLDPASTASDLNPLGSGGSGRVARVGCTTCGGWSENVNVQKTADSKADQSSARSTAGTSDRLWRNWNNQTMVEALKKQLLDHMVAEIVKWIQGDGDPLFVDNWEEFLGDIGATAADDFLTEATGVSICSPFKTPVLDWLKKETLSGNQYNNTARCTLDRVVNNIENFYNDFSQGGWQGYQELLEPQNNLWGQYLISSYELNRRTSAAAGAATLDALAGQGFVGKPSCIEAPLSNSADIDQDGIKGDIPSSCDKVTPGILAAELAKRSVGNDFDLIVNANQLSSYVALIVDALFQRLIDEAGGLRSTDTSAATDDTYEPDPNDTSPCREFEPGTTLREACEHLIEVNDDDFEHARDEALSDLDALTTPYTQSLAVFVSLKEFLLTTKAYLVSVDTTHSICVTDDDISRIDQKISQVSQSASSTETTINSFGPLRTTILGLEVGDWVGLMRARNEIEAAGSVDTAEAFYADTLLFDEGARTALDQTIDAVRACSGINPSP